MKYPAPILLGFVLLNLGLMALNIWLYSGRHLGINAIAAVVNLATAVLCAWVVIDIARMQRDD